MTQKNFERRSFLKLFGAGIGISLVSLPHFTQATLLEAPAGADRFKIGRPEWIVHQDGTFDLVAGKIRLLNCRPAIDGQSVFVRNTFMGDSPKGKRIIYELKNGFIMLDLKVNSGSVSIGAELSGMSVAPELFSPIAEAKIMGADQFFKQGYGFGGPSGAFPFPESSAMEWGNKPGEQAWSYDSYMTSSLLAGNGDTLAFGAYDYRNFAFRSSCYNRPHRMGIADRHPAQEDVFFDVGFLTEGIALKDDFIKLPDLYIFYGNQPFETMQHLAWNISENTQARKDTRTNYQWSSWNEYQKEFNHERLIKQLKGLDQISPQLALQTISVDDGYCVHGDWLDPNEKWPHGLDEIARQIFSHRYRAGIWVAPFMVDEKSKLFKEHPSWMIRDLQGKPIPEWESPEGNHYALDGSHPDAQRYIQKVFRTLRKMGFTYFRTGFLDWGLKTNNGTKRYDTKKTSVQILTEVLQIIRDEIGAGSFWEATISPFAPLIGFVDAVRVGNDVQSTWIEQGVGNMFQETYNTQYFNALCGLIC